MNKQNKRTRAFIPMKENPAKRRSGRPRKEEHLGQILNVLFPQPPPSHGLKSSQYSAVDPSDDIDDEIVGQVVTGVIEGSFEAGYFISIRATKTGALLRGVVFQPGLFTPVTAANDIAPHVKMYKRRDFPIPDLNPQPQNNNNQVTSDSAVPGDTLPRTVTGTLVVGRSNKFGLKKESVSPQLKSSSVFPLPKMSHTFAKAPTSTDSFQNKNICASAENKEMLHQKPNFSHQLPFITIPPTSNLQQDRSGASAGQRNMTFPLLRFPMKGKEMQQKNSNSALANKPVSQSKSDATFPLPTDMVRGNNLSRQNSDSVLQKQSSSKSQLDTSFPLPRRIVAVTLPLSENLSKKNASVSMGGKDIPEKNLKISLDNRTIPQLKSGMPFASEKVPMTDNSPKNNSAPSSTQRENPQLNTKFLVLEKPDKFSLGKQFASVTMLQNEKLKEGKITGQQVYGFGVGDLATPQLDSNRISIQNSIEGKKTGQQNYGFGLGDITTPRLENNRIFMQNSIEGNKTGQQNYGFGLGDVSTPRLDSNRISMQNSTEGKKTGPQNYGFGLGDVSTPRLESNRISMQNSIEGNKTGRQNYGFGLGDVSTPRLDSNRISMQNSIEGNKKGQQNHGFGLGTVSTPFLDSNRISIPNNIEGKKTGQQNHGFGLGDVSTPRLESNRIYIPNSIEGKKSVQQNHGFGLGDVTTLWLDKNTIPEQNGIEGKKDMVRDIASELTLGIFPNNLISSENSTPHELWYEFHANQMPIIDTANNTVGVSQSVPKQPEQMMEGITTSDSGLKNSGGSFQLFP